MNIQYEFDLKSGDWLSLELTKATRNDQLDSKESITRIRKNDLCIRDLGYITTPYLKGVIKNDAYFLNRLPVKMGVYQLINSVYQPVDWKRIHAKMTKNGLSHLSLEVFIDKKERIKVRMLIEAVSDQTAEKRIKNANTAGKRTKGYTPTEEYKIKAHYNIFITNAPEEFLSVMDMPQMYRLRWQIELIFKAWKSLALIDKVKQIKKERFECQLYAKLIWILLNWRFYQVIDHVIRIENPDEGCSVQKFFNLINKQSFSLRQIMQKSSEIKQWLKTTLIPLIPSLFIESRLKVPTHIQSLNAIFNS